MTSAAIGGWVSSSAFEQLSRSGFSEIGYTDAMTLAHLSRALYIPRHDRKHADLAVYDVSTKHAAAADKFPIGCTRYMVTMGSIGSTLNPGQNGLGDTIVAYDVNFNLKDGDAIFGSVKSRIPSAPSAEVDLTVSTSEEQAAVLIKNSVYPTKTPLDVTYPITPSATRTGAVKHPYFSFEVPGKDDESTIFQWQIHPGQHGRLRYTLVRNPEKPGGAAIQTVYYHLGLDDSFALPFSEGVLLLPAHQSSEESLVVTSALAMLWRLRELHNGKGKVRKGLKRLIGKK